MFSSGARKVVVKLACNLGYGIHDSNDDLMKRIEAVLHHRRVNDFNDHVDNPVSILLHTHATFS